MPAHTRLLEDDRIAISEFPSWSRKPPKEFFAINLQILPCIIGEFPWSYTGRGYGNIEFCNGIGFAYEYHQPDSHTGNESFKEG